jgi:hypothetical protein
MGYTSLEDGIRFPGLDETSAIPYTVAVTAHVPALELGVGDRIWYKWNGEQYVFVATLTQVRNRVIEVCHDPDGRAVWLDRYDITIIDREAA